VQSKTLNLNIDLGTFSKYISFSFIKSNENFVP